MDLQLLIDNLTNPSLLFFFLGLLAVQFKSDLEVPPNSAKFISMYLMLSIGFKGGQELAHSHNIRRDYLLLIVLNRSCNCGSCLYILCTQKEV